MMDKTLELNIDGNKVVVDDLPKPIRDMVVLFDRMREDLSDVVYQHNVLLVAISGMNAKIISEVQNYQSGDAPVEEGADNNVTDINGGSDDAE